MLGVQVAWIGFTRVLVWLIPVDVGSVGLDRYTLLPLVAGSGGHRGWYTVAPARPGVTALTYATGFTDYSHLQCIP